MNEKQKILTLEELKCSKPGIIREYLLGAQRFVVVRGGIHDWAMYTDKSERSSWYISQNGLKVHREAEIRALVECTDEAFAMYRH